MRANEKKRLPPLPPRAKIALRWAVYILAALLFYGFSTSGTPEHGKALLLLPYCLALSMFTGEVQSAAMGCFCGLLLDMSQGLLPGFSALCLTLLCGIISALFRQLLRKNIINYLILTVAVSAVYFYLVYFFVYRIWEFEGYGEAAGSVLLPGAIKTVAFSPLIYFGVYLTRKATAGRRTLEIEEHDEKIDRV